MWNTCSVTKDKIDVIFFTCFHGYINLRYINPLLKHYDQNLTFLFSEFHTFTIPFSHFNFLSYFYFFPPKMLKNVQKCVLKIVTSSQASLLRQTAGSSTADANLLIQTSKSVAKKLFFKLLK